MSTAKALTEAELAKIQTKAMVFRGTCADADACFTAGVYATATTTQGLDALGVNAKNGILEVFARNSQEYFQRVTYWGALAIAVRVGNKSQSLWHPWHIVDLKQLGT